MAHPPKAFVIGHPVAHSRSPLLHGFWLKAYGIAGSYERVDVAPADLPAFVAGLREASFVGGNVTVPHKTTLLGLVDDIDEPARVIGAINTLWFEAGRLWGGNTDALGFVAALDAEAPGWDGGRRALVLGAGGAARAVVHGLLGRGLAVTVLNRTVGAAEALARDFGTSVASGPWARWPDSAGEADLLVNATTLGMEGQPPLELDLGSLRATAVVCDIVYVPLETDLLRAAAARGHRVVNGLGMLLHQAAPGFARWFGQVPRVTPALRTALEADIAR